MVMGSYLDRRGERPPGGFINRPRDDVSWEGEAAGFRSGREVLVAYISQDIYEPASPPLL